MSSSSVGPYRPPSPLERNERVEVVHVEEPVREIARAVDPGIEAARIRDVVAAVRRGFTESIFQGNGPEDQGEACNINVPDTTIQGDEIRFARYWFPRLSLADYMKAVHGGLYNGTSAGLLCYDKTVGCYAILSLILSKEESEDKYEELVREFQCERHALHTKEPSDWRVRWRRENHPVEYAEEKGRLKALRLAALQQAVDTWKAKNLFADVIIPTGNFLINQMRFLPEDVACNDTILFIYKRLSPEEKTPGVLPVARQVYHLSQAQKKARIYYDQLNRSFIQRVKEDYLAPLPLIGRIFQLAAPPSPSPVEHAPATPPDDLSEVPNQDNNRRYFFLDLSSWGDS